MDNNKSYFFHTVINRGTQIAGVGYVNTNFDLRLILGAKYDKYEAFNIALEAFCPEGGGSTGNVANMCIHIDGFPFMNNYYDSIQNYSSSRVIELISHNAGDLLDTNVYNAYFLQNIHRIPFYRPATPIIQRLNLFLTAPDGTFQEKLGSTNSVGYMCIFSITGIDAYRVRKIPRPIVYRSFDKYNPQLVLNSAYATSIDPIDTTAFKKRIFRFDNVNWRQIIGSDLYDKYDKFALVTRRLSTMYTNVNYGNGNFIYPLYLSGSNLVFEYGGNFPVLTTDSTTINLHNGRPVIIGIARTPVNFLRNLNDAYIENVFYKPTQDIGTITIHYSTVSSVSLIAGSSGPNTANSTPFPTLVAHFEIIPVVDVS